MSLAIADLNSRVNDPKTHDSFPENWVGQHLMRQAVERVGDSIIFRPDLMKTGRFYMVEVDSKPYLYRKVGEGEVEVYGLAE